MEGISSQQAALMIGNRYEMILIGAIRTRELNRGWKPTVKSNSGPLITVLKEIESGKIGRDYLLKPQQLDRKEKPPETVE